MKQPAPNILLAEDNASLAEALVSLLEKKQLRVTHSRDGAETLSRIIADAPDLLILDLRLPRLNGVELLKKLRKSPKTRELPVIIISGAYRGETAVRSARRLGVKHYLEKPFRPSQLLAAVQDELRLKSDRDNARYLSTLCRAFLTRFSGRLEVTFVRQTHTIDIINGLPVFLRPGFKTESFGRFLHERGQLSAEELSFYLNAGERRHEVLVQMGCLDYPALLQAKLAYLTEELIHAGTLQGLQVEQTSFALPDDLQLVTVNMPRILHEIFRQTAPEVNRRAVSRTLEKYLAPGERYFEFINFLRLDPAERQLLGGLRGDTPLAPLLGDHGAGLPLLRTLLVLQMLQVADDPLTEVPKAEFPLRALFNAGDEEPAEAPVEEERLESFSDLLGASDVTGAGFMTPEKTPNTESPGEDLGREVRTLHARLQGKNFYQIFDLQQGGFSFGKLKDSYFGLTRKLGPETLMQLGGEEAELAQDILSTVATAYNTLSDVVKKERYDEMLNSDRVGLGHDGDDRFQAQVQYQSAKVFLEMEEWDNAERALQDACNIDPNHGGYLADLAWAIYRNPKTSASRALQEKSRQLLGKALNLEKTAEGFAYKGWMHLDAGQETLAEAEFAKALRINARLLLARQGMRTIQEKQEQEKKGLFRKMFR